MRYIEYIYLVVAGVLLAYLATEYEKMGTTNFIAILAGIGISAFMFSFRRNQRLKFEELDREEFAKEEEEEAELKEENDGN